MDQDPNIKFRWTDQIGGISFHLRKHWHQWLLLCVYNGPNGPEIDVFFGGRVWLLLLFLQITGFSAEVSHCSC